MSFSPRYSTDPTPLFTNEKPVREDAQIPFHLIIPQCLSEVVFISRRTPGSSPLLPPLSIYWLWSMQDADIFFYSCMVLYRLLLCMSLKKLESHRPHTFLSLWGEKKEVFIVFSPLTLSMNANLRVRVVRTAEGMMNWFMIFDNNELSWRRKRSGFLYLKQPGFVFLSFFFCLHLDWKALENYCLAPSVPLCTCALIRGDCSGHLAIPDAGSLLDSFPLLASHDWPSENPLQKKAFIKPQENRLYPRCLVIKDVSEMLSQSV